MKNTLLLILLTGMACQCFAQQIPIRETAPLPAGLRAFSSVSLPDGDVLVFGGSANAVEATNQAWRYDWETESWAEASPLAYAAAHMEVAVLSDGKVLAVGGTADFTAEIQTSQLLDPSTMEWTASAGNFETLLADYTLHSVVTLPDDYVLLSTSQGGMAVYDPATTNWAEIDPGPLDAGGAPTFWFEEQRELLFSAVGGQVYIPDSPPHTGSLFYLEPEQPLFQDGAVQLNDGRVLTMDLEANFDNDVSLYDPATRTAEIVTELPFNAGIETRSSILMADGRVLSFGFGDLTSPGDTKLIQVYGPEDNSWEVGTYDGMGPFLTPQMHLLPDNSIFAISGVPEPETANTAWVINREGATSTAEAEIGNVRLFPNPASGWLQIQNLEGATTSLSLFQANGRLAARWEHIGDDIRLTDKGLAPGIYFYRLENLEKGSWQSGRIIWK